MVPARRRPPPEPPPCRIGNQPKARINQGKERKQYRYSKGKGKRLAVQFTRDNAAFGETFLLVLFLSLERTRGYIERLRRDAQKNIIAYHLFGTTRDAAYRIFVMALETFRAIDALQRDQGNERQRSRRIDRNQEVHSMQSGCRYIDDVKPGSSSDGNPIQGGKEYSVTMTVRDRHAQRVLRNRSARKRQGQKDHRCGGSRIKESRSRSDNAGSRTGKRPAHGGSTLQWKPGFLRQKGIWSSDSKEREKIKVPSNNNATCATTQRWGEWKDRRKWERSHDAYLLHQARCSKRKQRRHKEWARRQQKCKGRRSELGRSAAEWEMARQQGDSFQVLGPSGTQGMSECQKRISMRMSKGQVACVNRSVVREQWNVRDREYGHNTSCGALRAQRKQRRRNECCRRTHHVKGVLTGGVAERRDQRYQIGVYQCLVWVT